MKKALLFLIFITGLFAADEFTITAEVDRNVVALDEQIVLQVKVTGPGSPALAVPKINDFIVYNGGQSKQSNFSIINGSVSSSTTETYTYGLTPKGPGKLTLPAFSVEFKGKIYKTELIEIEVIRGGKAVSPPSQSEKTLSSNNNIFIQITVDKNKVYVNEPVTMTFGFYSKINLMGQPQYSAPDTTGFWKEDLPPQRNYNSNGYMVTELKTALFPSQPGEFSIGKASLMCVVPTRGSDDGFFGAFFNNGRNVRLESLPVQITVLPLPAEGKPSDFSGTVGRYSLLVNTDKREVKTGDAVTLSVNISGTGNIKTITEPKLFLSDEFKKYETVSDITISKEKYEVKGSKVFKTILVPRKVGKLTIPGVHYSYFDFIEKKYKTLSSVPIVLNVSQGPKEEANFGNMSSLPAAEGVKVFGSDIRYIKQVFKFSFAKAPYYRSPLYVIFGLLPFLVWLVILFLRRLEGARSENSARFKASKAYSNALKKYKLICGSLKKDSKGGDCFAGLENILVEYIGAKINRSAAGLSVAEIKNILFEKVKESSLPAFAAELLEELHFLRFAPSSKEASAPLEIAEKVKEIIVKLEKAGL